MQGIIYIMLDHPKEQAKECWENFKVIQKDFQWAPSLKDSPVKNDITNFEEFEKVVQSLKDDIHNAHAEKTTN